MTDIHPASRIPRAPFWLTVAGLIPFAGFATLIAVSTAKPGLQAQAGLVLIAYGAVILSFLGGVRWGAEILRSPPETPRLATLAASVTGSLVGWAIVILAALSTLNKTSFLALAAMLVWQGVWDIRRGGTLPGWYPRLRLIASVGAVISLCVAALFY